MKLLLMGGTDPSGAGLQMDWKVIHALGLQAQSVVTAATAQHHNHVEYSGVLSANAVAAQLSCIKEQPSVIKVGMLGDEHVVQALINYLVSMQQCYTHGLSHALNSSPQQDILSTTPPEHIKRPYTESTQGAVVILDPVIRASSGGRLITQQGENLLFSQLLNHVDLITPNIPELEALTGIHIHATQHVIEAANHLLNKGVKAVFVKGGHFNTSANHVDNETSTHCHDFFISRDEQFWLTGHRWPNRRNVRGTGCLFATAVSCAIAQNHALNDAVVMAKALVSQAIRKAQPDCAHPHIYHAHLDHIDSEDWDITPKDMPVLSHSDSPNSSQLSFPRCDTQRLGIYPVVDSVEWIKKLVSLGIRTIQLRIKTDIESPPSSEFIEQAIAEAAEYCRQHAVRLFINDHWKLAIKHQAYGIHLGQEDLHSADLQTISASGCRIGLSTHSYTEIARTLDIQPSYIAIGPIYSTTSKQMPWIPQGVSAVARWVKLLGNDYPLVAIGGINHKRAKALKSTGIGSVAMITAITEAHNYTEATRELVKLWET